MANITEAFGLKPVRHLNGSNWNGQTQLCYVSASYGTALFVGDPVLWTTAAVEKEAGGLLPTINASAGTAGLIIRGVITSFEPLRTDLSKQYNPASTERYAHVCMDSSVVYQIRGDGFAALTDVVVGLNAVMIETGGTGDTVTGLSGFHLDEGTTTAPATTQDFTLHILNVLDQADNEFAKNMIYEVLLNTCENATGKYAGVTAA